MIYRPPTKATSVTSVPPGSNTEVIEDVAGTLHISTAEAEVNLLLKPKEGPILLSTRHQLPLGATHTGESPQPASLLPVSTL